MQYILNNKYDFLGGHVYSSDGYCTTHQHHKAVLSIIYMGKTSTSAAIASYSRTISHRVTTVRLYFPLILFHQFISSASEFPTYHQPKIQSLDSGWMGDCTCSTVYSSRRWQPKFSESARSDSRTCRLETGLKWDKIAIRWKQSKIKSKDNPFLVLTYSNSYKIPSCNWGAITVLQTDFPKDIQTTLRTALFLMFHGVPPRTAEAATLCKW